MSENENCIQVGRRLVPVEQIALVEPYVPGPHFQSERAFKSRVVLLDRDSVLSEEEVSVFVEKHGFRLVPDDGAATNPQGRFWVETFELGENSDFKPEKPFKSRLLWRDAEGAAMSVLMLTTPETLLRIAVRGEVAGAASANAPGGGTKRASMRAGRSPRTRASRRRSPAPA